MIPAIALPSSASAAGNCAAGDPAIDAEEANFLAVINTYRAQHGAAPLVISPELNRSAAWMATDMGTKGYFSHTDSLGRSPWARIADCGYSAGGGENLAAGTNRNTAQSAFELFRGSPGHNANMIDPEFRFIGIARTQVEGSTYNWYWATTFGYNPRPAAAPPAPAPATPPPPAAAPPPAPGAQVQSQAAPAPSAEPVLSAAPEVIQPPEPIVDLAAEAEAGAVKLVAAGKGFEGAVASLGRNLTALRRASGASPAPAQVQPVHRALLKAWARLGAFNKNLSVGRPAAD